MTEADTTKLVEVSKKRIIECTESCGDWKTYAVANGVKISTARRWIIEGDRDLPHGGRKDGSYRMKKEHVEFIIKKLESNC